MKKWLEKFLKSGIWLIPVSYAVLYQLALASDPELLDDGYNRLIMLIASTLPTLLLLSENGRNASAEEGLKGKEAAMRPKVDKRLLRDEPTGIILGKYGKKYVCKPLEEDGHVFLIGGSGSGKSSCCVIPTLLANPSARIFAIDIKGELSFKSTKLDDPHVRIFDPSDRNLYGYDPFYRLDPDTSTNQEILDTMQTVSHSLIPLGADVKDPFWKTSSRNLLTGLLIYFYKKGDTSFIGIIDDILGNPIEETIKDAVESLSHNSAEYRYLVQFSGVPPETLGGIQVEMELHLTVFSNDGDIRFAFRDNPRKCTPKDLDKGYSIYLKIAEHKLSGYYDVLQLIINQTLSELEQRPEDSEPVIFVIDELPRILSAGKIDRLLDGARTLRSRRVCLFLITQSTDSLMGAFTEHEVDDLISNCPYIIVLSASTQKTQKSVISWSGKYRQKKTSWSGSGSKRRATVSYEEKDIVDPSDLMTLKNTGEAIIITPHGYNRIDKCPYYEDKKLGPPAEEAAAYNRQLQNLTQRKGNHPYEN